MNKKTVLIIGLILGYLSFPLSFDIIDGLRTVSDNKYIQKTWDLLLTPGYGILHSFFGNCTKDVAQNGHGWVFIEREYFQCNKLEILISDTLYGEYKYPIDQNLLKKLKHNYRY